MTIDKIRHFIIEKFLFGDARELSDDTPLLEKRNVDSTGILEIVSFLEENFGIRIDDEELIPENLNSISRIASFLGGKMANSS